MIGGNVKSNFVVDNRKVSIIINQPIFLVLLGKKTFDVYVDDKIYKVFDKKGKLIQDAEVSL